MADQVAGKETSEARVTVEQPPSVKYRVPSLIEKLGKSIFVAALMPFLLLLLAVETIKVLPASLREHRRSGKWPRNGAFIARMKLKNGKAALNGN